MTQIDVNAQPEAAKLCFVRLDDHRLTESIGLAVAARISLRSELGAALLPIGRIVSEITS